MRNNKLDPRRMPSVTGFGNLGTRTKNGIVAGGLTSFVFGVYYYTMRAVGGNDELQVAIDKFEAAKGSNAQPETAPSSPS